ncbi:TonB-dependent receptor [Silanimonas lenta]|uniref:TonB-dependent receptor n=1 Tax=Silanimonas lenta TaxID=265429 RepID=UPI0003F973FF|nr:TonB-dependent receptor [Silanimonas lenta]
MPRPPPRPAHLACALLPALAMPVPAQDTRALLDLELEALLELRVSVASGRSEALRETPVLVSRLDAAEARAYGLQTLAEWLSLLPGVVVQESAIGTQAVMVRGLVEGFNQKVLFLLDGVPYWQPSHGDSPLPAIPLAAIERIELVRGPGGVLFGTNATGGVINIVTRRDEGGEAWLQGGGRGRWRAEGHWRQALGTGQSLQLAVSASEDPRYAGLFTARPRPPGFPPDTPEDGRVPRGGGQRSALVAWQAPGFTLRWHGFEREARGLAAAASLLNRSTLHYEGQQLAASHERTFGERHMLALHADWTRFTLAIPTARQLGGTIDGLQTFADDGRGNTRLRSGLAWQWQLGEAHFLQAGLERERRNTAEYQLRDAASGALLAVQLPAESRYETAGWLQFDGRFGDWRAVLGLRHVDSEVFGQRWLPRGSLLWQASERQSWRLVFSEGYNAPTPLQRNVAIPPDALRGNPELRPEAVRNLELAWSWQGEGQALVLSAYRLRIDQAIQRQRLGGGSTVGFANLPAFERHGIEGEWRRRRAGWQQYASLHWQREGDSGADAFARVAPRWQASLGLAYRQGPHHWGGALRYVGRRAAAGPMALLSLQYRFERPAFWLELGIDNALGDAGRHPDVLDLDPRREVAGLPPSPGTLFGLGWRF